MCSIDESVLRVSSMSQTYDGVCMSLPASSDDWSEMDCWWDAFTGGRQMVLAAARARRVDEAWKQQHWDSVGQLWDGFKTDHEFPGTDQFTQ